MVVVGGGLVGTLWSLLLRKKGYDVELFEKRADMRKQASDGGRSINLVITSRGKNGLEKAGLWKQVEALCVPVFGRMMHSLKGELSYQPYGRTGECNYSVSREELNKVLLTAAEKAGVKLHFAKSVKGLDFENRRIAFEGTSSEIEYEVLFGADGAGSAVRQSLTQKHPKLFRDSVTWLEADYKELLMPAAQGEALRKNALHIWPRGSHMMMALPNLDGSFTVTIYLPRKEGQWNFDRTRGPSDVQALFESQFIDAISLIPDFVEQFQVNPQGALGTVRCSRWVYDGSVALVGDAAHAIVPFFGQGMNAGFEDCTTLLDMLDQSKSDWRIALQGYENRQKANANAIADMALENWVEMRDKVADPQFLLRKKVESVLEEKFPEFYRSRYGMIAYTLVPYAKAQAAGQLQERILSDLCRGIRSVDELSLQEAERVLKSEFLPFWQKL